MSTENDVARSLGSWLKENRHEDADRVLDAVLDQLPATPQRRAFWLARRFPIMSTFRVGIAAAVVVIAAIIGFNLLPKSGFGGPSATATPLPTASPAPLAVGSFISHGAQVELDATGEGSNVTGSMTTVDVGGDQRGSLTVELACTRTTDSGLIMIGGLVIDSTSLDGSTSRDGLVPKGSHFAIVLQRGSPVNALLHSEETPHASCPAFLESIPDAGDPAFVSSALEPIVGTIELRP